MAEPNPPLEGADKIITRDQRGRGWVPDLPDRRDRTFSATQAAIGALPKIVDLRPKMPPVQDQGLLGSCTAHAVGAALQYAQRRQGKATFAPSRLFIYYGARKYLGTVEEDSGAMIRDAIKTVAKAGAPHESLWPYEIEKFRDQPNQDSFVDGEKHQAIIYQRVRREIRQLKATLAIGFPFVFGFSVYESFESESVTQTGIAVWPDMTEKFLGGHAVLAVGYDDTQNRFIVRNSYGSKWGQQGYFTMPYIYLLDENMSDDFWTINLVE